MEREELKQFIDQSIKEAHLIGLQSGKKETSGLVDLIIHKLETKIEESINKNVNGKIVRLTEKVDNYIVMDNNWREEDAKWKLDAQPIIDMGKNLQGTSKVLLYCAGVVLALGGAAKLLSTFFTRDL
jgi:hypothetical protein